MVIASVYRIELVCAEKEPLESPVEAKRLRHVSNYSQDSGLKRVAALWPQSHSITFTAVSELHSAARGKTAVLLDT